MAAAKPASRARAPKPRMSLAQAMDALEKAGSEQTRKTWRRHGARDPMFGVNYSILKSLLKAIGVDHELALALWDTGNYDARNLAYKVADPAKMSAADLDRWASEGRTMGCGGYVSALACEGGQGRASAERWLASDSVRVRAAGWGTVGALALSGTDIEDAWFMQRLAEIEGSIHSVHNDQRWQMNQALIAIGCRNPALRAAASASAVRIGKIAIDYGDTGCKTADALSYIEKTWAHSTSKGYPSPAAHEQDREPMRLRC